jgi:isoleucyl-tRNA synthetase
MSIVMAPILSFTADEIWDFIPGWSGKSDLVFEELFPKALPIKDAALEAKWNRIIEIRREVNKALELARAEKVIGHSLGAKVIVGLNEADRAIMTADEGIEKIFIVSELILTDINTLEGAYVSEDKTVKVAATASENQKCERCWCQVPTVGSNPEHPTICARCAEAIS